MWPTYTTTVRRNRHASGSWGGTRLGPEGDSDGAQAWKGALVKFFLFFGDGHHAVDAGKKQPLDGLFAPIPDFYPTRPLGKVGIKKSCSS
jgi:hypothetical protein